MNNNDYATQRPAWATDAMNADDIKFVEGYIDAVGWLPTAKPEEVVEFLFVTSHPLYTVELQEDHTFAKHKGWTGQTVSMVGLYGGHFNSEGVALGYTAGVAAALRIHRPQAHREEQTLARKSQMRQLTLDREMIDEKLAALNAEAPAD